MGIWNRINSPSVPQVQVSCMCSTDKNMAVFERQPHCATTLHVAWLSSGNLFLSSGSVVVSLRSTLESVDEIALLIIRCAEWPYSTVSPHNTKCLVSLVSQLMNNLLSIFPQVHASPSHPCTWLLPAQMSGDFPIPTCWLQTQVLQPVMVPAHQKVFFQNFSALRFQTPLSKGSNCFTSQEAQLFLYNKGVICKLILTAE